MIRRNWEVIFLFATFAIFAGILLTGGF